MNSSLGLKISKAFYKQKAKHSPLLTTSGHSREWLAIYENIYLKVANKIKVK